MGEVGGGSDREGDGGSCSVSFSITRQAGTKPSLFDKKNPHI